MTFTKEQLIEKLQHRISVASGFPGSEKAQMDLELARIALASLEAEAVAYMHRSGQVVTREECCDDKTFAICCKVETPLYTIPPAPVSVPEFAPIAYIFKHPAGRLFWSMTDESNKGQSDVMPVYSAPVPAFVPPAIEPDYEVIKGILPTANPDEYACCIAADMWNACRAAMLQGAEPVTTAYKLPEGWVAVPVEPTEDMIVNGFESEPDESFSDEKEWEAYDAMSGCQQAAHRAKLCWAAMIAAGPKLE